MRIRSPVVARWGIFAANAVCNPVPFSASVKISLPSFDRYIKINRNSLGFSSFFTKTKEKICKKCRLIPLKIFVIVTL